MEHKKLMTHEHKISKKITELPSQERLLELFDYYPDTGVVTRKISTGPTAMDGAVVGSDNGVGYLRVKIDGKNFYIHRIIWRMVTGDEPSIIDHADRDRLNNVFSNLRSGSSSDNSRNQDSVENSVTGVVGVIPNRKGFRAQLRINELGKKIYLPSRPTAEQAGRDYDQLWSLLMEARDNGWYTALFVDAYLDLKAEIKREIRGEKEHDLQVRREA